MSIYSSLLTTTGAAQYAYNEVNALATVLSQVALGDNNGVFFTPNINDGAINHQVYLASINSITVDPLDSTIDNVEVVLPYNVGGWTIREFRILDNNGTVMYTGNCEIAKSILSSGQAIETQIIFPIKRVNTSAVTLNFDSSLLATFQYVTNAITTHNNDVNAHGAAAWATKKGVQDCAYNHVDAHNTSTTTAYKGNYTPAVVALTDGMGLSIDISAIGTNTTPTPTFSPNGLPAYTIKKSALDGTIFEIAVGDLPKRAELIYVATGTYWLLINPATKGRLIAIKKFAVAGVYTFLEASGNLPYGTSHVLFKAAGAGAGGGGTTALGAMNYKTCGAGGSEPGYGEKLVKTRSDFVGITLTVGAKGVGVVGGTGTAGGTTSVGALMSCTGSTGGTPGLVIPHGNSAGISNGGVGTPGTSTGGDINITGKYGWNGLLSYNNGMGGDGASSRYGAGGVRVEGNHPTGNNATGNASSGGGATSSSLETTQSAKKGGDGTDGIIEAYCYG